jgi:hypothetical protein
VRSNWDYPGFYFGDVTNLHDLVTYWNLRDRQHRPRSSPALHSNHSGVDPDDERVLWPAVALTSTANSRSGDGASLIPADHNADNTELETIFGDGPFTICPIDVVSWNGLNLNAPMMVLGDTSQMGLLESRGDRPKLSFAFGEKPFVGDDWFHTQHLVASLPFHRWLV